MVECSVNCNHYRYFLLKSFCALYQANTYLKGDIDARTEPQEHGRGRASRLAFANRWSTCDAPQRAAKAARTIAKVVDGGACSRPQRQDQRDEGRQGQTEIPGRQDRRYLGWSRRAAAMADRGVEGRQEDR